jgi:hypothetical protein
VSNILNHPQYTGGYLNDVASFGLLGNRGDYSAGSPGGILARSAIEPNSSIFQRYDQAFSSNPRSMQLALKLVF